MRQNSRTCPRNAWPLLGVGTLEGQLEKRRSTKGRYYEFVQRHRQRGPMGRTIKGWTEGCGSDASYVPPAKPLTLTVLPLAFERVTLVEAPASMSASMMKRAPPALRTIPAS